MNNYVYTATTFFDDLISTHHGIIKAGDFNAAMAAVIEKHGDPAIDIISITISIK